MFIVFSDLDGTLLDHHTYSHAGAQEGIDLLRERSAPLVLVSSKTLREMTELHRMLGLEAPFVFENGGGIAWPEIEDGEATIRVSLQGESVDVLRQGLYILESLVPSPMKTIVDMPVKEVMERTGLPEKRSSLARERLSSLPFIFLSDYSPGLTDLEKINEMLSPHGLAVTRGGRFYHIISSRTSKGKAVRVIIEHYRSLYKGEVLVSMAVGDSENDIPMLKEVDRPCLVRKHDGSVIQTGLDHLLITKNIGPAGFSEAVKNLWTQ